MVYLFHTDEKQQCENQTLYISQKYMRDLEGNKSPNRNATHERENLC